MFTVYTATADGAVAGVVWLGELPFEAVRDKVYLGTNRREAVEAGSSPATRWLAKVGGVGV